MMLGRRAPVLGRLRLALGLGAAIWCFMLVNGFVVTDSSTSLMPGPINVTGLYMTALWLVTLVLAPLLACRDPLRYRAAVDVYLLGVLAILGATFLGRLQAELPVFLGGGMPIAAALAAGLILWAYL
jgi:hypothetical protein